MLHFSWYKRHIEKLLTTSLPQYYCSSECQKADWNNHLPLCRTLRNRKALYNAGNILQEIFYQYREKVFDKVVAKIEKQGGKLLIFEGLYQPSTTEWDTLEQFPVELCQDKEDKKTILVYDAGDDAVGWMQDTIEYTLSGNSRSCAIEEGTLQI